MAVDLDEELGRWEEPADHHARNARSGQEAAERIQSGEPFLSCLDDLGWDYIFRASADTQIETARGWKGIKSGLFDWERGRIVDFERVSVLLIGINGVEG
jgi:hypothetical protein